MASLQQHNWKGLFAQFAIIVSFSSPPSLSVIFSLFSHYVFLFLSLSVVEVLLVLVMLAMGNPSNDTFPNNPHPEIFPPPFKYVSFLFPSFYSSLLQAD